jgi:hypothetical protein
MSRKNTRDWQNGRFWRDKPVRERISAKHVLTATRSFRFGWSRPSTIVEINVDIEKLARKLDVLQPWERSALR